MATPQQTGRTQATLSAQPPSSRFDGPAGPRMVGPHGGKAVDLRSLGVRFMAWGEEAGGTLSLVEHPIPPRTSAGPLPIARQLVGDHGCGNPDRPASTSPVDCTAAPSSDCR